MPATILLVEDDKNQRLLYQSELSEEGHRILTADNGREAVKTIETDKDGVDLVVLDIRMPDMDGIEVLSKMLNVKNTLPVILHTAYPQFKENFMSWAAEAYVVKSNDVGELKQRVREVLARRGIK